MYIVITVLLIFASVLMILIVLVQNSKGGGLASNFQSSNQVMGVRKTNDVLDKITWWLAGGLLVLSIAGSAFIPKETKEAPGTEMGTQIDKMAAPATAEPAFQIAPDAEAPAEQAETPAEQTEAPAE